MSHEILNHVPLENVAGRYTGQLQLWENEVFSQNFNVKPVVPSSNSVPIQITNGEVLDSIQRPIWAMKQIEKLLIESTDYIGKVYFSDFFHPGLEALPYSRKYFKAFSFCWAQSFDKFDFTRNMVRWMRPYELMGLEIYEKVFVANHLLADFIISAVPTAIDKIEVVGLPFSSSQVLTELDPKYECESFDVVYSSRFDIEKNPDFFLDVVEALPNFKFVVCTGREELTGTDKNSVERAFYLRDLPNSNLVILEGLQKGEYYKVLHEAKIQFNCAAQDWVSFTLLEALTFRCMPVYPMFRSFIETFDNSPEVLYPSLHLGYAVDTLKNAKEYAEDQGYPKPLFNELLNYHNQTLSRIGEIVKLS